MNKTACITHFDGDCLVTQFWLMMYEKYWREEVDTIYANLCSNPTLVTPLMLSAQIEMFAKYPEIKVNYINHSQTPEVTNNQLLPQVKEDCIFLTETDNFIFQKGLVKECLDKIRLDKDIIAPEYAIIPPQYWEELGTRGFGRNMFFIKRELLDQIEVDFLPRQVDGVDFDCFGWISYQIAKLNPKISLLENHNLNPYHAFKVYEKDRYVHVRQFNSSNLGFGAGKVLKAFRDDDEKVITELKNILRDNPDAQWQYEKSVAFRYLMLTAVPQVESLKNFYKQYAQILFDVEKVLNLDSNRILAMHYYYKGLFQV